MNENNSRINIGKKCSLLGILLNLLLFGIKLFASIISHSLSAITDAFNNLSDASSGIISYVGFLLSSRDADTEHPYGHARYEYLSALGVAAVILFIAFEFLKTAVKEILNPTPITISPLLFVIMVISVALKLCMMIYFSHMGKKINSDTLIATAVDARNDVFMTSAVIIGYILSTLFSAQSDGFISLVIALFIFISGISLIKDTIDPLLGQAPDKEKVAYIQHKILSYPNILGTHDLIIHDYGHEKTFASVHVEMSAELTPMESHDIIDKIEEDFRLNDNIHMIIHMDPIEQSSHLTEIRDIVNLIAKTIHPQCSIHDLKLKDSVIEFDCCKPASCTLSDEALITAFKVALCVKAPSYDAKITIDTGFSPIIK